MTLGNINCHSVRERLKCLALSGQLWYTDPLRHSRPDGQRETFGTTSCARRNIETT
jgi:hypothetical protein